MTRNNAPVTIIMDLETAFSLGGGGSAPEHVATTASPSIAPSPSPATESAPSTPSTLNNVLHVLAALTAIPANASSTDADTAFANVMQTSGPAPQLSVAASLLEKLYSVSPSQFATALSLLSESNRNALHEKLLLLAIEAGDNASAAALTARTLYLAAARILNPTRHLPEDARYGTSGIINDAYTKLASLATIVRPDASNPSVTAARTAASRASEAADAARAKINELTARMRARGLTPDRPSDPKMSSTMIVLIVLLVVCVVVICVLGALLAVRAKKVTPLPSSAHPQLGGNTRQRVSAASMPSTALNRSAFNDGTHELFHQPRQQQYADALSGGSFSILSK